MLDQPLPDMTLTPAPLPPKGLAPLAQSDAFYRALLATGQAPLRLPEQGNMLVTRRRVAPGLTLAMINRARHDEIKHLRQTLRDNGLGRTPVILSPDHPCPNLIEIGALPLISPAAVALLDLTQPVAIRHAALHQKWRNRLTRAQSAGLQVRRQAMPHAPNHWLFTADAAQQRQRGYRSWPTALTLAYAKANKGQAKLFQAFEGGTPIAAILILRHGNSASYHIAHATARGKTLSAHNLLIWEAMAWLASEGCQQLDLGVINTEEAPGLARFKLGTGAQLSQLGGTWLLWPPMGRLLRPIAALDRARMRAPSDAP